MNLVNRIVENEVVTLTLNRPERLNALSVELFLELKDLLTTLDSRVKVVLLTGAGGKAFAAGADIRQMSLMTPEQGESFAALAQTVTELIEQSPVPFIACVDGHALGGGCELAMSCDFIYATEKSKFGQPEVNLGLIPGFGGCVRLQRLIGPAKAKEMIFTGISISADEAKQFGLVNKVFATQEMMLKAARATAQTIAEKSNRAVALSKQAIQQQHGLSTHEGLAVELKAFRKSFEGPQKIEGVAAFLGKRKPIFS